MGTVTRSGRKSITKFLDTFTSTVNIAGTAASAAEAYVDVWATGVKANAEEMKKVVGLDAQEKAGHWLVQQRKDLDKDLEDPKD
ncbi:hypothetical protein, partial [Klebsiella pneumoniae]|uniref:hypothetical protein n=1 Tax=Klebsiella pneumoniae TaxID=573 RepID=UPI001E4FDF22